MKRFALLVLSVLLFIWIIPMFAQEVTPEPDSTVVVNVPAPVQTPDGTVVLSVWQIIVGIGSAIALGGIGGVAGVGVLASRLRHDAAAIAAIEKLGDSVPPSQSQVIVAITERFAVSLNEVTKLVTEALDRVPAATKPPEVPTTINNNVTLPSPEPASASKDW